MSRIVKEIAIYALCVIAALLINAYAIAAFHTHWSEFVTTFPITLVIALVFYVLAAILRIFAFALRGLLRRRHA